MTDLQKEFEATGYTSWINSDLYPDGKIYTQEYTEWLERQVLALRQPPVIWRSEQLFCKCSQPSDRSDNEIDRNCFNCGKPIAK